ncbi:tRNA-splicing endonuclease subunit Sen54 [Amphibalanus amphitrite]|uniref:tRNA-splicing endonuclease subunit Sen54 n=1 Tax=Amphibalanus amphitrite TaxID=1232801 RepID=A0A6A4V7I1_AMPAM|nr:tRNA-splicing endonuclease subunit Sen54 [Amphibalanus amphitrite]
MDEDVIARITTEIPVSTASPEVLLRMAQGGSRSLPESGEKWSETPPPEDGWLAAEQERARTEELFSLLAEPLVVKRSELVTAAWLPDEDRAELSAVPGKFWQYMGYEMQRRKFLRWEEAVMLCEMGVIQMTSDGQPCSLQEVRARVLSSDPDREQQYRLYAHLTRLGYRPVRHGSTARQNRATDRYFLLAAPAELLPPGVRPRNHWYAFDLAAARRGRLLELSKKNRPGDRYPSCLPVIGTPVRNWAEFKQKPVYDVYPSDAPFRKSAPPLPEFRVFIVRPEDRVAELSAVPAPTDKVPLCAAVLADVGPPALYTVVTGRLPVDSSVLDQSL